MTEKEYAEILTKKNTEILELKNTYEERIKKLEATNTQLLKQTLNISEKDIHKLIARLYANGFGVGSVHKIMTEEENISIELEEVSTVISKLDYASDELRTYYLNCKQEFLEKIKFDSSFFAQTIIKQYEHIENETQVLFYMAKEQSDIKQMNISLAVMKDILKEKASVISKKGLFEDSKPTEVTQIMKDMDKKNTDMEKITLSVNIDKVLMN